MRDRRTGAAGTEQADMAERDVAQSASKRRGEAGPIGIVADALAVPENDGVDRADRLGVGRKPVEQRQHGLLARMRDIDAGEPDRLRGVEQSRQIRRTAPVAGEVDQLIMQREAEMARLVLVQRRGARPLDTLADQADQKFSRRRRSRGCAGGAHRRRPPQSLAARPAPIAPPVCD